MQWSEYVLQIKRMLCEPEGIMFILLRLFLFLIIVVTVLLTFHYLQKYSLVKQLFSGIYKNAELNKNRRRQAMLLRQAEVGEQDQFPFLERLDRLLVQSGMPLQTDLFFALSILAASVLFCIVTRITQSWLPGAAGFIAVLLMPYGVVSLVAKRRSKQVETQLMPFANVISNFSRGSDDLIEILEKASWYLEEPLHTALRDCVLQARNSGDVQGALFLLQQRLPHPKFGMLIRNLETASRYEANYGEIVKDSKQILSQYLKYRKEQDAIYTNGKVELACILGVCILVLSMVNEIVGGNIQNILFHSLPGQLVLCYLCAVTLVSVWFLFLKRGER